MAQTIELKNFYKVSTNLIYKGLHWTKRKEIKDDYLTWFLSYKDALRTLESKVGIQFDYYWKTKPLDSSNCTYMSKMIEDCMVHYGILENDTIEYVGPVTNYSHKSDRDYDYCVVTIEVL